MEKPVHEIEVKRLLVGDGASEKLLKALGNRVSRQSTQVNYIFDTEERSLDKAQYALRLRIEDSKGVLTAKGPSRKIGCSTASKLEAESSVPPSTVEEILSGRRDPLATLKSRVTSPAFRGLWYGIESTRAGHPLKICGHFENLRRTIPVVLSSGLRLQVQMDRTRFPDGSVETELEIELPGENRVQEAESWLENMVRRAGIETRTGPSKIVRFFDALERATK
jgi:uncharacterized protein YjbK